MSHADPLVPIVFVGLVLFVFGLFVGNMFGWNRGWTEASDFDIEEWKKTVNDVLAELKTGKKPTLRDVVSFGRLKEFIEKLETENECRIVFCFDAHAGEKGE
jgi:hypothetical protein